MVACPELLRGDGEGAGALHRGIYQMVSRTLAHQAGRGDEARVGAVSASPVPLPEEGRETALLPESDRATHPGARLLQVVVPAEHFALQSRVGAGVAPG